MSTTWTNTEKMAGGSSITYNDPTITYNQSNIQYNGKTQAAWTNATEH